MGSIKKVLVVDDSSTSIFLLESLLKEKGYNVFTATTGEAGLKSVKINNPDLILLDIMMPKKTGFEVLEILKSDAKTSHIPVIIISAKIEQREIDRGLSLGAYAYLIKPLDIEKFYKTLTSVGENGK